MRTVPSLIALAACLVAAPAFAQEATPASVDAFVTTSESDLSAEGIRASRAAWIYQTYITGDTEALTAATGAEVTKLRVAQALQAAKYAPTSGLSADTRRKLTLMRTSITDPAPTTPGSAEQFATIKASLQGTYGKGKGTLKGQPINGSDIEAAMGSNRNPDELKEMWASWHDAVDSSFCNRPRVRISF